MVLKAATTLQGGFGMGRKSFKHKLGCKYQEFSKSANKAFNDSGDKQLIISPMSIHVFDHPAGTNFKLDVLFCPCCGVGADQSE